MRSLKHILILALIIGAGVTAWALTPVIRRAFLKEPEALPVQAPVAGDSYTKEERALFDTLGSVYNKVGQLRTYLAEGNIRLMDKADTGKSILTPFRYCHQDSLTYYKLGDQEIIAIPDLSITVNHSVHKIFMSPRGNRNAGPQIFINEEQLAALKKEQYVITREDMAPLTVIRLTNENHRSCREYRVSYDSAMFIRRVFMRMSDEEDPADRSLDKYITVSINNWQTANIPAELFKVSSYVQRNGDNWEPVAALRNYEVKYIY
ncbi:hypothetical protein AAHN97_11365 [Chitinophaga niabensis]|uniref:hypothetical protein n=1 Tax=Chitinophaga niabensis TaxID=536979 RepID=UPI0031BADD2C